VAMVVKPMNRQHPRSVGHMNHSAAPSTIPLQDKSLRDHRANS
jgi:hypothetical protein